MLEVTDLRAGYGPVEVLRGVSLRVAEGVCVALIGPNGAGKTTLLRAIAGLPPDRISRRGIGLVTEESNLFLAMTVRENLLVGAHAARVRADAARRLELAFGLFPVLRERRNQRAGTLSGGERKMLGLARGLMASPRLLLVDEPSLGLAPKVAATLFDALAALNREAMTILVVEQNVHAALRVAGRGYVIEQGR